jgi:hypothetical protein
MLTPPPRRAQRNRLVARLTGGHRRYRLLAEHSDEVIVTSLI